MGTFTELKRRNVFRVGAAYVVAAWLIAQIADIVLNNIGSPPWVIKSLFLILGIGFVVAIVVAWAYELTPEGVKRERDVIRDESITHITAKKLDYVTLVAALGVAALIIWQQLSPASNGNVTNEKTIAVLPFLNLSAEEDNEYFSDGISEELLNVLVRVEGLQVASRTSAFSFKGKDVDIPTMAAALRVNNIVEGSVRRSGDQVRITAQLIDVNSDRHLWSETYTRELSDVFAIQDEIAEAIADALQLTLLGAPDGRKTDDIQAHDLYLLGRHHFHLRSPESLVRAIDLFEQSIAADPDFALAYSGLADAYSLVFQYGDYDPRVAIPKAEKNARKAVELAPELAEAHASLGLILAVQNLLVEARQEYRRAIELNPDYSMAHMWLGTSLGDYPRDALEVFRAAEKVDPLHPIIAENIGSSLSSAGLFDEGAEHLARAIANNPDTVVLYVTRAHLEFTRGDLAEAYRLSRQALSIDPTSSYALATITHSDMDLGNLDKAQAWVDRFEKTAPDSIWLFDVMFALQESRGNFEAMLKIVEQRKAGVGPGRLPFMHMVHAAVELRLEDPQSALALLEQVGRNEVGPTTYVGVLHLTAYAQQQLGRNEESIETARRGLQLVKDVREAGWNQPWISEHEAVLYAVLGQTDEAIERLQAAHDQGLRNVYGFSLIFLHDELLGDDPRYQEIRAKIFADVARQQQEIAAEISQCEEQPAECTLAAIDGV